MNNRIEENHKDFIYIMAKTEKVSEIIIIEQKRLSYLNENLGKCKSEKTKLLVTMKIISKTALVSRLIILYKKMLLEICNDLKNVNTKKILLIEPLERQSHNKTYKDLEINLN